MRVPGKGLRSFPLTPMQQGLLFHRLLDQHTTIDVQQVIGRFREAIDPDRIERAWQQLFDRHDELRTSFEWEHAVAPRQIVHPTVPFRLQRHDWRNHDEVEARFIDFLRNERARGFAIGTPPLIRIDFFERPDGQFLTCSFHHALLDTPSMSRLLEELFELYDRPSRTAESAPRFQDFVAWRDRLDPADAESFWRKRLHGFTAPTPLLSLPLHDVTDDTHHETAIDAGTEIPTLLASLSLQLSISPLTPLLAAWSLLLSRYSGESDVVFGIARSRREHTLPDADRMIGMFINTIPARVPLPSATTVADLLHQIDRDEHAARNHEQTPLVSIQKWSDLPAGSPLFESLVIADPEAPGAHVASRMEVDVIERTSYPLVLTASLEPLTLKLTSMTSRFDHDTTLRIAQHFARILSSLLRNPHQNIDDIDLLDSDERRRLVDEWNATARDYPRDTFVHTLFETRARETPDKIAVRAGGDSLTYAALDARANQIAARLRALGVRNNSLVAVLLDRSGELIATLLGILKAGGAYVPLDPTYPKERLDFMLEDSDAAVLVTRQTLHALVSPHRAIVLSLDEDRDDHPPPASEPSAGSTENLVYVIYTSGSTGKPKGVQIPHRALCNFLHSMQHEPGISSDDVVLALTTLSFDIAGLEIYLPLISGARLELVSRETAADARKLIGVLEESGATLVQATPATWRMLIDAGWKGDRSLKVLCGGEAMSRELALELLDRCGELWNMYGPTETTIWSTIHRVSSVEGSTVPVGRPIANTQIYILDELLRPVPTGVSGELHIGGEGVALGYLGRAQLTAERFVVNPFASGRMYKTGDSARWLPDGTIEYLGRLDTQVKLRGYRIEAGEIESALRNHPKIADAVVTLRTDGPGGNALVAYLLGRDDEIPEGSELRSFLKESLPEYMIPSFFVPLDRFPLTPNGKVDRRALPAPQRVSMPDAAGVAPRDDLERRLARIWCDVLRLPDAGIRDNFFELGGESLLAVQMFVRIEAEFGREMPLATLFQAPTIESLAERLRAEGWDAPWSPLITIQPNGSEAAFFCVHGVGGNVLNYRSLAEHLGEERPFYGLQARGLDGKVTPIETIEEMASVYLSEIRKLQPHGPYLLGGSSFGGVVAFEMAQQLVAKGEEAGVVALFDTNPVHYSTASPETAAGALEAGLAQRLAVHLRVLVRGPDRFGYLRKKARRVWRRTLYRAWQATAALFQKANQELPAALQNVQQANYRALREYVPRRYPGRVVLFVAREEPEEFTREKQRGWSVLADEVEVRFVPGDHLTMIAEPHVVELARQLREVMR